MVGTDLLSTQDAGGQFLTASIHKESKTSSFSVLSWLVAQCFDSVASLSPEVSSNR